MWIRSHYAVSGALRAASGCEQETLEVEVEQRKTQIRTKHLSPNVGPPTASVKMRIISRFTFQIPTDQSGHTGVIGSEQDIILAC